MNAKCFTNGLDEFRMKQYNAITPELFSLSTITKLENNLN